MKLIDSHAHLTFKELAGSLDDVLQRSSDAGVTQCITIGTDTEQNKKTVAVIEKYENIFGAVGIHPHYASDISADDIKETGKLANHKKIVAIGETGLDFHYNTSKKDAQKILLVNLIEIASEKKLPVIIHSRDAFDETIEIIDRFKNSLPCVVFHCWGGTAEQTQIILDKGFFVSFTGVVTFKNAAQTQQAAKMVPLDRMMIETDCPYMSPEPMRKQRINEPALLIHTAKKIADLKQIPLEQFADEVTNTTKKFFRLP
ncbi:MAG: TatD family hydrolase [Sedimentisphaerales bacterium]|nr:TatD family hydrolase [Sedimentisphaerales bacterium]